jgi:hypothetical protein
VTASIVYDPKLLTGYHMDQLATAFDRVRDSQDWKAPISAEIAATDRGLVEMAVLWFTNTVPSFATSPDTSARLRVTASGYRGGPFGDGEGRLHLPSIPDRRRRNDPWDLDGPIPGP